MQRLLTLCDLDRGLVRRIDPIELIVQLHVEQSPNVLLIADTMVVVPAPELHLIFGRRTTQVMLTHRSISNPTKMISQSFQSHHK